MSAIYFDATSLDVVDEWLQADDGVPTTVSSSRSTGAPGASSKVKKGNAAAPAVVSTGIKNAGIGYVKPAVTKQDELAQRLAKQREAQALKRKRENGGENNDDDNDDDDEGEELDKHGVVEDVTLSKAALVSKSSDKKQQLRVEKEQQQQPKRKQKKKEKKKDIQDGDGKDGSSTSAPSTKHSSSSSSSGGAPALPMPDSPSGEKRKRTKTRSKQKNIRKDSRAKDVRPNYRPLSLETEKILEEKGLR